MQKVDMKHFLSAEERHYKYKFNNSYLFTYLLPFYYIPYYISNFISFKSLNVRFPTFLLSYFS